MSDMNCGSQLHEVKYTVSSDDGGVVWSVDMHYFSGNCGDYFPVVRRKVRQYTADAQAEEGWRVSDFQPKSEFDLDTEFDPDLPDTQPVGPPVNYAAVASEPAGDEDEAVAALPYDAHLDALKRVEEATKGLDEVASKEEAVNMLRAVRQIALAALGQGGNTRR